MYIGVGNKAKNISSIYVGVGVKAKNVVKGYVGVSGKAKLFFNPVTPPPMVSFSAATDQEVIDILDAHYNGVIDIGDYWSVGDVRQASSSKPLFQVNAHTSLRTFDGSYYRTTYSMPKQSTIKWQIIGINHDTLTTSINGYNKAAITIQTVGLLSIYENNYSNWAGTMSMNNSDTTLNSWKGCQLRKYLTGWASNTTLNSDGSGNFYNACNFKSLIKKVNKSTNTGHGSGNNTSLETTNDYVFLLSEWEIFGKKNYSVGNEGCTQYTYWANHNTDNDRIKKLGWEGASGAACDWWERSPKSGYSHSFCYVGNGGGANNGNAYDYASSHCGVAPACCL